MQTATSVGAVMIATTALLATSAEAGRVRVSQEMDPGVGNFVVKGFVKTFEQPVSAAQVYDYNGRCALSYGGVAFDPKRDATVMAVVDTTDGQALFMVHDIPVACFGDDSSGGTANMSFVLTFDRDDSMECLVEDDPDEADCGDPTAITTTHSWFNTFTDGLVLGALDGRWQLDASFDKKKGFAGIDQVIVRSGDDGDITGLDTDRTIRFDNAVEVRVDVQPGADVGCLNSDGNGVIPVAIYGGRDFDVTQIKTEKLAFAGLQVRVRGNGQHQCSVEHVNDDGYPDLACQFYDDPDAWTPGSDKGHVTGESEDSTPFYGEDSICIRPPA